MEETKSDAPSDSCCEGSGQACDCSGGDAAACGCEPGRIAKLVTPIAKYGGGVGMLAVGFYLLAGA